MLSNLDLQVSFPRPIVIVNAIGARCISKGGLWIYMLMHTSNTLIDTRVWFDMISSRTCSFPPCLSCFYMVSFGLPKRVVCVCVCACMYACSHLTKKLPKITAVHLRLISGNGDTASYHRRICTRNLASQTNQAGEGQHYTVLYCTYICMWHPSKIHDHGSYASRNNAWKEYHVVVAAGWRRQPLKLQNITCQYLGGLSKKWDDPTPGNGKKHPNRDTKLWSLESWDHRIILNDT